MSRKRSAKTDEPQERQPPFTNFGWLGRDMIDARVFDQAEYWVSAKGEGFRIEEMPEGYQRNVLAFLLGNAERFRRHHAHECREQQAWDAAHGRPTGPTSQSADNDAMMWLTSTPLYRQLAKQLAAR